MFNNLYKRWMQNFAQPLTTLGGLIALCKMNKFHRPLINYSSQFIKFPQTGKILDIGCGGGYNISFMCQKAPQAEIYGVDYSKMSVRASVRCNKKAIKEGRVKIYKASVSALPFKNDTFDLITASETIYFWPDLAADFCEVKRVLKPNGVFMACCNSIDEQEGKRFSDIIGKMRVYSPHTQHELLERAGFKNISEHLDNVCNFCITAQK